MSYINNFKNQFSPGQGIEHESPALRAGDITTKPPRRSNWPSINIFSYWIPPYPLETLVPSIRVEGEHLYWHYFLIRSFYVNDTYRQVLMKI